MRTNQARKTGPALLDPPAQIPAAKRSENIRRSPSEPLRTRREHPGSSQNSFSDDGEEYARVRRNRRIRRGLIPQTRNGRLFAAALLLVVAGTVAGTYLAASRFVHRDPHFVVSSSSSIELHGNAHLSRSQLLSVFGEDIDQNIFDISLKDRRDQLEQMPWVEHAAVMRLLPNRLRVDVTERTPVAFVRQGGSIGMADAQGILLDIPPDAPGNPNYSFPVVTGLKAEDSAESRQGRMHLYAAMLKDLDSEGKKVSADLSEVDLSDPEDVKVLLPSGNAETLVHLGTEHFLERYKRFQEHIGEWRSQYPRLTGVDMRYERQVVLQMPPKDSTVTQPPSAEAKADKKAEPKPVAAKTAAKAPLNAVTAHTAAAHPTMIAAHNPGPVKPPQPAQAPPTSAPTANAQPFSNSAGPVPSSAALTGKSSGAGKPAVAHSVPAKPAPGKNSAQHAEMAKRVEAIKAWMAKRQKMRDAQAGHSSATP